MDKVIPAAEANRQFSSLLRRAREGESFTVTSHGRPVARIVPADEDWTAEDRARDAAHKALFERLRRQPIFKVEKWTRDELYEDE